MVIEVDVGLMVSCDNCSQLLFRHLSFNIITIVCTSTYKTYTHATNDICIIKENITRIKDDSCVISSFYLSINEKKVFKKE